MDINIVIDYMQELVATFMQLIYSSNDALQILEQDKNLSVPSMECVKILRKAFMRMNGTCKTAWYILEKRLFSTDINLESYAIDTVFEGLIETFESTVREHYSPEITYKSKLPVAFPMLIDKRTFEFIIFSLLFCCLKNTSAKKDNNLKISIYATEDTEHNVFHIKDNNECLSDDIIDTAFSGDKIVPDAPPNCMSFDGIITLTLKMAIKAVERLEGKLEYAPLKHGNRFDVYLPNYRNANITSVHAPSRYVPSRDICAEIFTNVTVMDSLQKVIDAFEKDAGEEI